MNVFILCTGRCGSLTFTRACGHMTNFTTAHESRVALIGDARLACHDTEVGRTRLRRRVRDFGRRMRWAFFPTA